MAQTKTVGGSQQKKRTLKARPVTFFCIEGQHEVTEERFPGPMPTVCHEHIAEHTRERVRKNVQSYRDKKKQNAK